MMDQHSNKLWLSANEQKMTLFDQQVLQTIGIFASNFLNPNVLIKTLNEMGYIRQSEYVMFVRNSNSSNFTSIWYDVLSLLPFACSWRQFRTAMVAAYPGVAKVFLKWIKSIRKRHTRAITMIRRKSTNVPIQVRKYFFQMKKGFLNGTFENPTKVMETQMEYLNRKLRAATRDTTRQILNNKVLALLCTILDAQILTYSYLDGVAANFKTFQSRIKYSSSIDFADVTYYIRLALLKQISFYKLAENERPIGMTDGEAELTKAHTCAVNLEPCFALGNLYLVAAYHLIWRFETTPTEKMKTEIMNFAKRAIICFSQEDTPNQFLWTRCAMLRMIFCCLGINNNAKIIQNYEPSTDDIREAGTLLDHFDKQRSESPVEKRSDMFYALARSRLNELLENYCLAYCFSRKSKHLAIEGNFREKESVLLFYEYMKNIAEQKLTVTKPVTATGNKRSPSPSTTKCCQPDSEPLSRHVTGQSRSFGDVNSRSSSETDLKSLTSRYQVRSTEINKSKTETTLNSDHNCACRFCGLQQEKDALEFCESATDLSGDETVLKSVYKEVEINSKITKKQQQSCQNSMERNGKSCSTGCGVDLKYSSSEFVVGECNKLTHNNTNCETDIQCKCMSRATFTQGLSVVLNAKTCIPNINLKPVNGDSRRDTDANANGSDCSLVKSGFTESDTDLKIPFVGCCNEENNDIVSKSISTDDQWNTEFVNDNVPVVAVACCSKPNYDTKVDTPSQSSSDVFDQKKVKCCKKSSNKSRTCSKLTSCSTKPIRQCTEINDLEQTKPKLIFSSELCFIDNNNTERVPFVSSIGGIGLDSLGRSDIVDSNLVTGNYIDLRYRKESDKFIQQNNTAFAHSSGLSEQYLRGHANFHSPKRCESDIANDDNRPNTDQLVNFTEILTGDFIHSEFESDGARSAEPFQYCSSRRPGGNVIRQEHANLVGDSDALGIFDKMEKEHAESKIWSWQSEFLFSDSSHT